MVGRVRGFEDPAGSGAALSSGDDNVLLAGPKDEGL
jgi:hypothetical protein